MPKTDWSARSSPPRRRPWLVPSEPAGTGDDGHARGAHAQGRGQTAGGRQRKHFVEPYPYTDEQRERIDQALAACGLGDATAREIFIGAIAYDLAVLQAALTEHSAAPTPAAPQSAEAAPALTTAPAVTDAERELASRAGACAEALAALDVAARQRLLAARAAADPFRRDYGAAYLDALTAELTQVAAVLSAAQAPEPGAQRAEAPEPTVDPSHPPAAHGIGPDEKAVAFVRHAASVYGQCFDARSDADPNGPFAQALKAVGDATGIAIPTDASLLRRALDSR
jgi:hypothetical protein